MEEQNYILFETYLSEEMTAEERSDFESRLETDTELRNSFETYKEFSNYLENKFEHEAAGNAFKENLKQISEKHFSNENKSSTVSEAETKVRSFKPWQLAIAASILFIIGIGLFQQFSTPSFNDYNDYDTISLTLRGDQDVLIQDAEEAFNQRNFTNAVIYFEKLSETDSTNTEYKLYHAISLLELNFFDEADAIFSTISEGNSVYKYQAVWYHALSALKQENKEKTINLLKTIPDGDEHYKKAQKLLKKLK